MGTIQHHAIIVTGSQHGNDLADAHAEAVRIFPWVSELSAVAINGYRSFFVPPDGSKEGWKDSEVGNDRRDQFQSYAFSVRDSKGYLPFEFVVIEYGELGQSIYKL